MQTMMDLELPVLPGMALATLLAFVVRGLTGFGSSMIGIGAASMPWPSALPEILIGMRIAIGFGWTRLVAASTGLGQAVLNARNFLRTDIVVMGNIVMGVVA